MISLILKENTKHLHDQTEARFNSQRIFEGTFTREDYENLLQYNYLFLLNFEKPVFDLISEDSSQKMNLDKRVKLPLVTQDVQFMNIERSKAIAVPQIKNEAEALGILYVMEGSTLGGNMIAKQLSKHPDFKEVSFGYFRCYGENTGSFWKNFKSVLDEVVTPEKHGDCIAGSVKAYQFLLSLAN
ncbi:MAG: biliverdin-producing heme oxygenase [Weeksellaceae bacterium]|nr:biliverdin-producing heme oxygenase [Weeksellaceae bacterium]